MIREAIAVIILGIAIGDKLGARIVEGTRERLLGR
jgi:hypothetical protein